MCFEYTILGSVSVVGSKAPQPLSKRVVPPAFPGSTIMICCAPVERMAVMTSAYPTVSPPYPCSHVGQLAYRGHRGSLLRFVDHHGNLKSRKVPQHWLVG